MKKIIAMLLACLMIVGLFAGCGKKAEEITLTVWGPQNELGENNDGWLPTWCEKFNEAHPEWDITFTYEDERGVEFGDDKVLADTAYMQINFFTPKKFDYMALKEVIKTYLEEVGIVTSTTSRVYEINNEKIRQTTFTVEITKERN